MNQRSEGSEVLEEAFELGTLRIFLHSIKELGGDILTSGEIREVLTRIMDERKIISPEKGGYLEKASYSQMQKLLKEIFQQLFGIINDKEHLLAGSRFSINVGEKELRGGIVPFLQKEIEAGNVPRGILKDFFIFEILEDVDLNDKNILGEILHLYELTGSELALDDFPPQRNLETVLSRLQENNIFIDIIKIVHREWNDTNLKDLFQTAEKCGIKRIVIEKLIIQLHIKQTEENVLSKLLGEPSDVFNSRKALEQVRKIAEESGYTGKVFIQSWENGNNLPCKLK